MAVLRFGHLGICVTSLAASVSSRAARASPGSSIGFGDQPPGRIRRSTSSRVAGIDIRLLSLAPRFLGPPVETPLAKQRTKRLVARMRHVGRFHGDLAIANNIDECIDRFY